MKALGTHLWVQLQLDVREKGTLLNFYLVPLVFFFVMGAVFASVDPALRAILAASMTVFAVTMGAIMGVPTPLVRMRETGTLRTLRVSGIPRRSVLTVQAVSAFCHLLIVSVVIYVVAPFAFQARVPLAPGLYFTVTAVLLFASIGLGLLIGVAARDQAFATMLSMVVFLPSVLLTGIMFPASMLPQPLQWLSLVFPATYVVQSFDGLAYGLNTSLNPVLSLAIAAGIGLIGWAFAIWSLSGRQGGFRDAGVSLRPASAPSLTPG